MGMDLLRKIMSDFLVFNSASISNEFIMPKQDLHDCVFQKIM